MGRMGTRLTVKIGEVLGSVHTLYIVSILIPIPFKLTVKIEVLGSVHTQYIASILILIPFSLTMSQ